MSAFSAKSMWTLATDNTTLVYAKAGSDPSYKYYNNMSWSMWGMWNPCTITKQLFSMYEDTSSNNRAWLFSTQTNGTLRAIFSWDGTNFADVTTQNSVLDFGWHHFAITFSNGAIQIYVDGVLQTLTTIIPWTGGSVGLHAANLPLLIANYDPTSGPNNDASADGCYSNFSMWSKVLTQSDVTALFNNGQPGNLVNHPSFANCTNWWRMDQTDTLPTLTDSVASGASMTVHTSGSSPQWSTTHNVPIYFSDPGVSNVLAGVQYTFMGNLETGTLQQVFNYLQSGAVLSRVQLPTPSSPQLTFTQGDQANLIFFVVDQNGNAVNLSGATFSTQINGANGVPTIFGNAQHSLQPSLGINAFQLSLATTDTPNCSEGTSKSVVTTITQSGNPLNFWGNGILSVLPPSPAF